MSRRSGQTKPKKKRNPTAPSKPKTSEQKTLAAFQKRLHDLVNRCEIVRLRDNDPNSEHLAVAPEALYHIVSANYNQRLRFDSMKTAGVLKRLRDKKKTEEKSDASRKTEARQSGDQKGDEAA